MKISGKEAENIVCDGHEDFEMVEEEVVDTSRWSNHYSGVAKHLPSGKYYSLYWSVGATEQQCERPFEDEDEVVLVEVELVKVTIDSWEPC